MENPQYTNLHVEINFVQHGEFDKSEEILDAITELLKEHGWESFSGSGGMDESKTFYLNKAVFFPKECI